MGVLPVKLPRLLSRDGTRELDRLTPTALSLDLVLTGVSHARMTLPLDTGLQVNDLVELYDGREESAGIFRVNRLERRPAEGLAEAGLEHALALLGDQVIFGPVSAWQVDGTMDHYTPPAVGDTLPSVTVRKAMHYLLTHHQTDRTWWQPGICDFTDAYAFSFEDENLLDALLRTAEVISEPWRFTCDFSTTPWTLGLRRMSAQADCELRPSRNLISLNVETQRSDFVTRLYPVGKNNLRLTGAPYLEADTLAAWGCRSVIHTWPRVADKQELLAVAWAWLQQMKNPVTTVEAVAADLSGRTGEELDRLRLGSLCRVCLPGSGILLLERVKRIRWPDLVAAPLRAELTMANREVTMASLMGRMLREG